MFPVSMVPPNGDGLVVSEEDLVTTKFASYDETGRLDTVYSEPRISYYRRLNAGQRLVMGEGGLTTHYVEFVGDVRAPVLRPRPELDSTFDKSEIAVREGTTISDLAPASVTFEGPVKGQHEHPGGDLVVGWTVPGTYTVTIEAFPALPATFTLTVGAAA
nr:hypothetical protein [Methylorubrum populi]